MATVLTTTFFMFPIAWNFDSQPRSLTTVLERHEVRGHQTEHRDGRIGSESWKGTLVGPGPTWIELPRVAGLLDALSIPALMRWRRTPKRLVPLHTWERVPFPS